MGSVVSFSSTGSFDRTQRFLDLLLHGNQFNSLEIFAQRGVAALAAATPTETGATAASWDFEIERNGSDVTIWWTNSHKDSQGTPIVIMLQFGHGTGTGGYVQGRDFINPAIEPIFNEIADSVWNEVNNGG
jgi:hypothetical protein